MKNSEKNVHFMASVARGRLSAWKINDGDCRLLFTLADAKSLSFRLSGDQLLCRDASGQGFPLPVSGIDESQHLLGALHHALRSPVRRLRLRWLFPLILLAGVGGMVAGHHITARTALLPGTPVHGVQQSEGNVAPASPFKDGWALPPSVRATLPAKLKLAADRDLFTVRYSSGHARTLYVFADPDCPNCQREAPVLDAVSRAYNVEVFPVSVIGGEKSVASVTAVLCLPPDKRITAWRKLFDPAADMGTAGAATAAKTPACDSDLVKKVLGVNDVAYHTYRIPGTPWVVTDDGRSVPQAVLNDSRALAEFMASEEIKHGG